MVICVPEATGAGVAPLLPPSVGGGVVGVVGVVGVEGSVGVVGVVGADGSLGVVVPGFDVSDGVVVPGDWLPDEGFVVTVDAPSLPPPHALKRLAAIKAAQRGRT